MDKPVLQNVVLHITDACTSHCECCYACSKKTGFKHADIDTLFRIIDELSKAHIERVSLLGGDPALYPNIMEVAKYLHKHGIDVALMSNTMKLPVPTEEVIKCIDFFETTIHGDDHVSHDNFCHEDGAYNLLIRNLHCLSDLGAKIGIAVNIIPKTADKIFDIFYNLSVREKLNISYVVLQRIIPFGRAKNSKEFSLKKEYVENALNAVERVHRELGLKITVEDPFPLCVIDERYHEFMHPCEWGYSKAALNADGDLTRCGADTRYNLLGNILRESITQIWENAPSLKEFREKRYLPSSCHECDKFARCGGGCSLSHDKNSDDDGVDYLFAKYRN